MKTVRLCIFSNCTDEVLSRPTILDTYKSWVEVFGEPENLSVYVDPNPNPRFLKPYSELIKQRLGVEPIITKGLADSYHMALQSKEYYLFMVEHDWTFQNINHSLDDIIKTMQKDNLWFMLFNKRVNDDSINGTKWQSYFKSSDNQMYCLSDRYSNNPHIINRKYYLKNIAPRVDWTIPEAGKIEQVLQKKVEVAVYGKYNHPPTIVHLDGRGDRVKKIK